MMTEHKRTHVLVILDGWGINESADDNAIHAARTPVWDELTRTCAWSRIQTSGLAVGLPEGQMGNSEVGHMNIGAGRPVYQNFTRINKAIEDGSFFHNPELERVMDQARDKGRAVHLIGLLSTGGVHSHLEHFKAASRMAAEKGITKLWIHAFLDGRDTPPRSALEPLQELENTLQEIGCGRIVSVVGRYYAMDRDNRWDRVEKAWQLLVKGQSSHQAGTVREAVEAAYAEGIDDEFCPPTRICGDAQSAIAIDPEDSVIFMNFRPDRARELTRALIDNDFSEFDNQGHPSADHLVTLTQYAADIKAGCAFPPEALHMGLGEYLSSLGRQQLRLAETEKYAHVTFFFNGGREEVFEGESRILVPSPQVATYDLQPEMSAPEVTQHLVEAIDSGEYDLIVCNYANGDMVGHTGSFPAAVKAVEAVDQCVGKVVDAVLRNHAICLITADHGNVEQMRDDINDQPNTAHTTFPVPLLLVGDDIGGIGLDDGALCDLAPTLLDLMALPQPLQMTGRSLLHRQ